MARAIHDYSKNDRPKLRSVPKQRKDKSDIVHVVAMKPFHAPKTQTRHVISERQITNHTQRRDDEEIELPSKVPKQKPGRPRKENNLEVPLERQSVSRKKDEVSKESSDNAHNRQPKPTQESSEPDPVKGSTPGKNDNRPTRTRKMPNRF